MARIDLHPRRSTIYQRVVAVAPSNAPTREYLPWAGVDWSHSVARPGCQDFLVCPSIVNGVPVPRKAPLINGESL